MSSKRKKREDSMGDLEVCFFFICPGIGYIRAIFKIYKAISQKSLATVFALLDLMRNRCHRVGVCIVNSLSNIIYRNASEATPAPSMGSSR